MRLGELLLRKGVLNDTQLSQALTAREGAERIGQTLIRLKIASEEQVMRGLAEQAGLEYVDLSTITIDPALAEGMPLKAIFTKKVIPIARANGAVRIATADPLDLHALDDLRLLLGCRVEACVAKESEIVKAAKRFFGIGAETIDQMMDQKRDDLQVVDADRESSADIEDLAEDATLIRFVNQMLLEALQERASDIHIEPFEEELRIRYRIDGVLQKVPTPATIKRFQAAIVSRLKIMASLNIAEKRLPQDGRIKLVVQGREIDLRVSIIPNLYGEGVVLRILDRSNVLFGLRELGMPQSIFEIFEKLIAEPHGILLVTGPTGSGKTTTLYAALQQINSLDQKIITVEDPVEYYLPGIEQIPVKPKIGLTFASGLRAILRHDPDIILIGEIRDLETAEIAVQASLTGHLVFSTLHTNDAPGALTRLTDMGVEPFLIASTVEGILAQRLVRKICQKCRTPVGKKEFEVMRPTLPEDIREVFHGVGCESCRGTGYRGRSGIFEMLPMDEKIREFVMERTNAGAIKKFAIEKRGMLTLRDDGWERVRAGLTTPEEVLRVTKSDEYTA
ncbi:MAG: type II secretion system ATPase GspE [Planctomycetes bacterium]|nr:type II secretion system ATPase GspE [Planctomycetota bacterium]